MSNDYGPCPRILRSKDHPSTPETVAEITACLRDLADLRFIVFGQSPDRESLSTQIKWAAKTFAVPAILFAILLLLMGPNPGRPHSWPAYWALVIGAYAMFVFLTVIFHRSKNDSTNKADEHLKGIGITENRLHLVHLHSDAIERTTYRIDRLRSVARYQVDDEVSYAVPLQDSGYCKLSRIPLDPELDALMMRDADQWTTRQPRVRAEADPAL